MEISSKFILMVIDLLHKWIWNRLIISFIFNYKMISHEVNARTPLTFLISNLFSNIFFSALKLFNGN
jgi:hypothetical protein